MFENIFKKLYKSRKTVTEEEKQKLQKELEGLKSESKLRKAQIEKFNFLITHDPQYKEKYSQRMNVHKKFVSEAEKRIDEIEIILLDS